MAATTTSSVSQGCATIGEHRADVGQVAAVPVEVDRPAEQRLRRDVGVVADDENHGKNGQPAQAGAGDAAEPVRGNRQRQDADRELD